MLTVTLTLPLPTARVSSVIDAVDAAVAANSAIPVYRDQDLTAPYGEAQSCFVCDSSQPSLTLLLRDGEVWESGVVASAWYLYNGEYSELTDITPEEATLHHFTLRRVS